MIFSGYLLLDVLSVITALAAAFIAYFKWSYQYWKGKNVPYLEPIMPFGNFENPLYVKESLGETVRRLYNQARAKGWNQCGIYGTARPLYLLVDLELVKHVMTKDFKHFVDRGTYLNEKDDPLDVTTRREHRANLPLKPTRGLHHMAILHSNTKGHSKEVTSEPAYRVDCRKMGTTQSKEEVITVQTGNGTAESTISISIYEHLGIAAFAGFLIIFICGTIYWILRVYKRIIDRRIKNGVREEIRRSRNLQDLVGSHLFAIGGKKWRNLRVKLTPTFTSGKLKAMFQTLIDCGIVLEKYFQEKVIDQEPIDIKDVFARFTTDIIGSCAFGLECNTFKEPNSPFRLYGERFFLFNKWRALQFAIAINFPKFGKMLGIRTVSKDISDFFMKVVEDTVAYREKNNYRRKDFLQLLIDLRNNKEFQENGHQGDGKALTMNELAAQCFVFFIAGFETSSTTATFVLYELARHQEIQDKVRKEIKTVLAKHDNEITYDSLNELTYMKQVVDEALRMYPPLPIVTRVCVEDYKVPGTDVILEKNTSVFIPIVGIHNDKEYYENPTIFDPDRFTEENKKNRHPYAHIPFGEGPRVCIGERFGIMQTKVGLTSILRNFRVTVNEKTQVPLKLSRNFITTAEGGVWLDFHKI